MIVRILGDGQYELDGHAANRIEALDADLGHALAARDEEWFTRALSAVLAEVRESRARVNADRMVPSDLALPSEGSSLDEVSELLDPNVDEERA